MKFFEQMNNIYKNLQEKTPLVHSMNAINLAKEIIEN